LKIAIVDTYYSAFLASHYQQHDGLAQQPSAEQLVSLLTTCFGTSDFYSRHLRAMGHEAQDLIVNCRELQAAWAKEQKIPYSPLALKVSPRLFRLPLLGRHLAGLPGFLDIAVEQIRQLKPDVLYCQDLSFFPGDVLREFKSHVSLIVGQIACPLPPESFVRGYDLILTSFPHFVPRIKALGVASAYFKIGFETRILDMLGKVEKDVPVSFVGGITRNHTKAMPLLETLAQQTPIQFFGYGAGSLPKHSPIRQRHHGEVWGAAMYRSLARSKITLNRHIDVAENNANNMRLYEATGVGSLLLTDRKDNLSELFVEDQEVVCYSDAAEAVEKIQYYLAHPDEAAAIAQAGQARTLREHTYQHRMTELVPILQRYLTGGRS
jgi:spore maturation protein CgeB